MQHFYLLGSSGSEPSSAERMRADRRCLACLPIANTGLSYNNVISTGDRMNDDNMHEKDLNYID